MGGMFYGEGDFAASDYGELLKRAMMRELLQDELGRVSGGVGNLVVDYAPGDFKLYEKVQDRRYDFGNPSYANAEYDTE